MSAIGPFQPSGGAPVWSLLGEEPTWSNGVENDANDPQRRFGPVSYCIAKGSLDHGILVERRERRPELACGLCKTYRSVSVAFYHSSTTITGRDPVKFVPLFKLMRLSL
jgi:hypothetical protein